MPRYVAERPRLQLALNVTLGAVLAGLLALAVFHGGQKKDARVDIGTPATTLRLGWDDYYRMDGPIQTATGAGYGHGELEWKVSRVALGPRGWRVYATVANESPFVLTVRSTTPVGTVASYPRQPFSLLIQEDNGSGIETLKPLPAREFMPAFPASFQPHAVWRGTFAGPDPVPARALFYVGLGQFTYSGSFGGIPFSTSSVKTAKAP